MRLFSTDPDEPGVFAVGQVANGIFAFGQMATGVVAIGQLARGFVAVGQLAIGFVAIGQACYAVGWGGGMFGLTGRGFGLVLKVLPKHRPDGGAPAEWARCVPLASVIESGAGTIRARVRAHAVVLEDGRALDAELAEGVGERLAELEDSEALVRLTREARSEGEGNYREAPHVTRALVVREVLPWRRWSTPFEAIRGDGPAPAWQLVLRGVGGLALLVGWAALVGSELIGWWR